MYQTLASLVADQAPSALGFYSDPTGLVGVRFDSDDLIHWFRFREGRYQPTGTTLHPGDGDEFVRFDELAGW